MEFVAILIPETAQWSPPLAIMVTTIFAAIQLRGVALGALIQEFATSTIGVIIIRLSLVLFFVDTASISTRQVMPASDGLGAWSLVIATINFTYDGWLYASYFNGEIREALERQRDPQSRRSRLSLHCICG